MITTILVLLTIFSSLAIAQEDDGVSKANETVAAFKEKDKDITKFFNDSYGYVVFPAIGKGAAGVGGAGGNGTVFKGGSAVGDARMTQFTVGLQLGGQKFSEIIFFENAEAYERFIGSNFEFTAQVTAIALKSGVAADAQFREGMLVFTMGIGGLMYEAAVGGQKFKVELYKRE